MLRQFGLLTAAISQLFFLVCVGFFIGNWLDTLFSLSPIIAIFFALSGIVLGFRNLIYVVKKNQNSDTHS